MGSGSGPVPSTRFPKFVIHGNLPCYELRKPKGTSAQEVASY